MTTAQMTTQSRAAIRPGTDWPGWVGYAPQARGPEARRARALAAGLEQPLPVPALQLRLHEAGEGDAVVLAPADAPLIRCSGRHRGAAQARPVRSAPRRPSLV